MLRKVEISILALLIIFAFYCAYTVGSSWDEYFVMSRGEERLKYLLSLGAYGSPTLWERHTEDLLPGFFATFATFLKNIFPKKYEIESWHLINSFFSILTFFGIYKISSLLFNKQVGKIVFLLCFINPILFGHMAINSKDTIVALANVWSTYIFLRYIKKQNLNTNSYRYILLAGLAIGIGTGTRTPFLVTLFPLLIIIFFDIFFIKKLSNPNFSFKKFFFHASLVLLIAYMIMVSCWPHVHENIFIEPFKKVIAQISCKNTLAKCWMPWTLHNGKIFDTSQLPNSYVFVNFFYKSPEFILALYSISVYFFLSQKNFFESNFKNFWLKLFLILFIILFPAIIFAMQPYNVYDGLRLFLYTIPYYNIIPAIVIYFLICNFKSSFLNKFLSIFIGISFVYYIFIFVSLAPYQYVYLNRFIGNFSESHKKFENDYWAISTKELVKKISNDKSLFDENKRIKITFCGAPHSLVKKDLQKIKKLKYDEGDINSSEFDYVIMTNRVVFKENTNFAKDVTTCYDKFKGKDIVVVKRNNLVLSTLRKKN